MIKNKKVKDDFVSWFTEIFIDLTIEIFNDYPPQAKYGFILEFIREQRGVLISVYRNGSGYLWAMQSVDCGTDYGYCGYSGNCENSGTFKTYNDAMEKAIELQTSYGLNLFKKETRRVFHWGNYAKFLINKSEKEKETV